MALEDRDWYREEPSKNWKKRWDPLPGTPRGGGRGPRKGIRVHQGAWLAVLISAALFLASWHWHLLRPHKTHVIVGPSVPTFVQRAPTPYVAPPTRYVAPPQANNLVRLGNDPKLDVPATQVHRWSVTDAKGERISVYVPIGETPRQALTVALAQHGTQVVP